MHGEHKMKVYSNVHDIKNHYVVPYFWLNCRYKNEHGLFLYDETLSQMSQCN